MSTKTNKLRLEKPYYSESADVSVINKNMDIIDDAFAASESVMSSRVGYGALLHTHWRSGTLTSAAGGYSSSDKRVITPHLPLQDNLITVDNGGKYAVYFYDADKAYLPDLYIPFTTSPTSFSTLDLGNAEYFRLVMAYSDDSVISDISALTKLIRISVPTDEYVDAALSLQDNGKQILFTDLEQNLGWWNSNGGWLDETHYHSQLIAVVPGKTYYVGYKLDEATLPCFGACFDRNGNWCGHISPSSVIQYDYKTADGMGTLTDYVDLYYFVAPSNAHFVSLNMSVGTDRAYRNFISSKPIYAFSGSGNYEYSDSTPYYQAKKDLNLCVFGASGVAIDRRMYPGSKYTIGFQEYLVPWYNKVDSYGYWGRGWRANTSSPADSIYYQIVEKALPITEYNEFLLIPSTSNVDASTVGDVDSTDVNEYAGALNAVINYIYTNVPDAKIYLANAVHKKNYSTDETVRSIIDAVNDLLAKMSTKYSLELIDLVSGSGINQFTQSELTSDGTHLNSKGNKVQGLYLRRQMIGF